jgi:hypothetical protein
MLPDMVVITGAGWIAAPGSAVADPTADTGDGTGSRVTVAVRTGEGERSGGAALIGDKGWFS